MRRRRLLVRLQSPAFAEVVHRAIDQDILEAIHGQHSEPFAILGAKRPTQIEGFAAPLFGIVHRGAHLTSFIKSVDGLRIRVLERNDSLKIWPGALVTTVARDVRAGDSPFECIVHEAPEEASLPEDLIRE